MMLNPPAWLSVTKPEHHESLFWHLFTAENNIIESEKKSKCEKVIKQTEIDQGNLSTHRHTTLYTSRLTTTRLLID